MLQSSRTPRKDHQTQPRFQFSKFIKAALRATVYSSSQRFAAQKQAKEGLLKMKPTRAVGLCQDQTVKVTSKQSLDVCINKLQIPKSATSNIVTSRWSWLYISGGQGVRVGKNPTFRKLSQRQTDIRFQDGCPTQNGISLAITVVCNFRKTSLSRGGKGNLGPS